MPCRHFGRTKLRSCVPDVPLTSVRREVYEPLHPPNALTEYLAKGKHLGKVDMTGVAIEVKEISPEEEARLVRVANKPPIDECLSLYDFEVRLPAFPTNTADGSARRSP